MGPGVGERAGAAGVAPARVGTTRAAPRFGQASHDQSPFRPFGRAGTLIGVLLVALVVAATTWSALASVPPAAQRPTVFGGSLVLADTRPLTVIDLATGRVTVRLAGVDAEVGAADYGEVQPVAVQGGTMLVDRTTGSFNFLGADDYVDDPKGPVSLGALRHTTGASGLADGTDTFVLRSGPLSTVSLVGPETVIAATRTPGAVTPLGSADLPGPVDLAPGGSVIEGGALWALYGDGGGCDMVELAPAVTSRTGLIESNRQRGAPRCERNALESDGTRVGLAVPGRLEIFGPAGPPAVVATSFTRAAMQLLPVTGASGQLWFLAREPSGWSLFGAGPTGQITGPFALSGLGAAALPAVPALAGGFLYTLDQSASPQPQLWAVDVANGQMAPLAGMPRYPILSTAEREVFRRAEVLLDGPRVVFNNPGSLEAVVVFTDGSAPPMAVDKSTAVTVSAAGPADMEATPPPAGTGPPPGRPPAGRNPVVPVVAPVSRQVTCAKTTQKPYAPQITTLTPSPQAVLVAWSYALLDQTDCEPDSWTVRVTALSGGHQPARAVRAVAGQTRYLFTGLRPTTTYQVVVTADINVQSTPSTPATFATTARGPDAPLRVRTVADGHGNWAVSWTPCTEEVNPDCVVPAGAWSVSGASCGGSFVGSPPVIQVPGGSDEVVVSAHQLQLLGDSLSFSVQGALPSGLTGNPTSDGTCTQAWQAPAANELTVQSSGVAAPDKTITATVAANLSGDMARLQSSHPGQLLFVYQLAGRSYGPTDLTSAVFEGVAAGATFRPAVTVYPTGHREASVTVEGSPFVRTLAWPTENASASATVDPADPNRGTVAVSLPAGTPSPLDVTGPDPSSGQSGAVLQCGGPGGAESTNAVQPVGPDHSFSFVMSDLTHTGGQCALRFTLTDTATPDPYGVASPVIEADFTIGRVPDYSFRQGYSAACSDDPNNGNKCGPGGQSWQLVVSSGGDPSPVIVGGDWVLDARAKDRHTGQELSPDLCSVTDNLGDPSFPYTLTLPDTCPVTQMDDVDITVSFEYLGRDNQVDAGYPTNKRGSVVARPTPTTTSPSSTTTTTVAVNQ